MTLCLLELNDDVLREIVQNIYGVTALHFVLVSKRAYELAIHRVAAVVRCTEPGRLLRIHNALLHGPRPLARYVEDLVINCFPSYPEIVGQEELASEGSEAPEVMPTIPLIVDLVQNAPNLRRLTLRALSIAMDRDSRLEFALRSLRQLRHVEFCGVGDGRTMGLVGSAGWDLGVLSLDFSNASGDPSPFAHDSWPTLLGMLHWLAELAKASCTPRRARHPG